MEVKNLQALNVTASCGAGAAGSKHSHGCFRGWCHNLSQDCDTLGDSLCERLAARGCGVWDILQVPDPRSLPKRIHSLSAEAGWNLFLGV